MSSGNIVEIIGAVVDVEFPRDSIPRIYDALLVEEAGLTLEVQQQLGDGIVRCIAMGSTDGVKRGVNVADTGAPISVPVGKPARGGRTPGKKLQRWGKLGDHWPRIPIQRGKR